MKTVLSFACCILFSSVIFSQNNFGVDSQNLSPKPTISVNGVQCNIGYGVETCLPKTCDSLEIFSGESIEFCTSSNIDLSAANPSFFMQWNFSGSNISDSLFNNSPTDLPVCYEPVWNSEGNYTITIFYKGATSGTCPPDYKPSQWIVNVKVIENTTGINQIENDYFFFSVSPNPVSDETKISFHFLKDEHVLLEVFDVFGKRVSVLADEKFPSGKNEIKILNTDFRNTVYFVRIKSENYSDVKRIIFFTTIRNFYFKKMLKQLVTLVKYQLNTKLWDCLSEAKITIRLYSGKSQI